MEDNFWNDEMRYKWEYFVKEHDSSISYLDISIFFRLTKLFEDFKQSKSSTKAIDDVRERIKSFRHRENKNHVIVYDVFKFQNDALIYPKQYFLDRPTEYEIYSALSKDKVEFKIGDIVNVGGCLEGAPITSFELSDQHIIVFWGKGYSTEINDLKKIQPKEERVPLFTSVDGFSVYEGDKYFAVDFENTGEAIFDDWVIHKSDTTRNIKFFGSRTSAEKWISYNQKSISFSELEKFVTDQKTYIGLIDIDGEKVINANAILKYFKPKHTRKYGIAEPKSLSHTNS